MWFLNNSWMIAHMIVLFSTLESSSWCSNLYKMLRLHKSAFQEITWISTWNMNTNNYEHCLSIFDQLPLKCSLWFVYWFCILQVTTGSVWLPVFSRKLLCMKGKKQSHGYTKRCFVINKQHASVNVYSILSEVWLPQNQNLLEQHT